MQQSPYIYNNLASQSHSNSPTKEEYENISLEEQPINKKDYYEIILSIILTKLKEVLIS